MELGYESNPVPFRKKSYNEQYKKYDWVEIDLVKNKGDFRPESYRPLSHESEIKIIAHIDSDNNWEERKKYCLGKVYYNLSELIAEAKNKDISTSLAVFRPTEIIDFIAEPVDREWDKAKIAKLNQLNLFETTKEGKFEVVRKVPYKFSFIFTDNQQKQLRKLMIEDWETGQLYWNCLARHEGNEQKAVADVRKKYFDDFAKTKDLYFFLGTTQRFHAVGPNPFIIIGTFHPKKEIQGRLF